MPPKTYFDPNVSEGYQRTTSSNGSRRYGEDGNIPLPFIRTSHSRSSSRGGDPGDSSSSSSSDSDPSDSDSEVRVVRPKKERPEPTPVATGLKWKRLDFSLDKENHLTSIGNWDIYQDALMLALTNISVPPNQKLRLSLEDDSRLAIVITKTCRRQPLELVTGLRKGSKMLKIFRRTYTDASRTRGFGI